MLKCIREMLKVWVNFGKFGRFLNFILFTVIRKVNEFFIISRLPNGKVSEKNGVNSLETGCIIQLFYFCMCYRATAVVYRVIA
jgi:hypothetical protein